MDISTVWVAGTHGDWAQVGPGLLSGNDIQSAVLLSVFTDREAGPDDVIPDGSGDPRGWCLDDPARPIGSRLWLLARAKQTRETANRARDYIAESLQWLIDDGVVAKFDITTQWVAPSTLGAQVVAYNATGTRQALQFKWAWNGVS
ncbi:phage GP46 family protein [Chromobacterium amazonense]|uniref:phage GP46 family protein n=1 Tax=Chromobacterium amazonense TaxID=1382803 RepID=UPI00237DE1F2|nr:phage GP46 family protein [Chromobacterium amazonense]MDE1715754.1 phage GP46 family protein [Chromobacterium amazonense]